MYTMFCKFIQDIYESIKRKDEVPEYAKDFRKEWLYITRINKKCGDILSKLENGDYDDDNDLIYSIEANSLMSKIKKFLKYQECGRLKDISGFYFKYFDVNNIYCLEEKLRKYPYPYPYHFLNRDCFCFFYQKFLNFLDLNCFYFYQKNLKISDNIIYIKFPSYKFFFKID